MTAKIRILPSDHEFVAEPRETLLEAALRAGLAPNYSCSNGSCGQCKARLVSGRLASQDFHDYVFSEAEKSQGSFLMCRATATQDIVIEATEAGGVGDIPFQQVTTRVNKLERIGEDFLVLHVRTPRNQTLRFLAGQHVSMAVPGLAPRNKSIASCPCNAMHLQFHIRRMPDDPFADYLFTQLRPMMPITLAGPFGNFTLDDAEARPLILLAYETGFAPIKSLIEHAISLDYPQPIHLYWVVRRAGDHYLENYCRSWTDALDNFTFTPLVGTDHDNNVRSATAQANFLLGAQRIVADHPNLKDFTVYINGPESALPDTNVLLLAHGLPQARLHIDFMQRF